jgi:hypothetical protein
MPLASICGDWAYRFTGFTIMQNTPCYLVGMGTLTLKPDGTVSGRQTATITPLTGTAQALMHRDLAVSGTYVEPTPMGSAKMTFQDQDEDEVGTFDILHIDDDHFWMISTGAVEMPGSKLADEVNSGEAVRIRSSS